MRLNRFLRSQCSLSRKAVRSLLAEGRVEVDGCRVMDGEQHVTSFSTISLDGEVLQTGKPCYLMLNKPAGIVSATQHPQHSTVIDLIALELREGLHLAGRLDLNTTGLVLLSNDGLWTKRVTRPELKVDKVYLVETEQPVTQEYVETFSQGIYFSFEDLTTAPATLQLLESHRCRLTLSEGRYHQVKRMFGYFDNRVTALHRERIGAIVLDPQLSPGEYRSLTDAEIASVGVL